MVYCATSSGILEAYCLAFLLLGLFNNKATAKKLIYNKCLTSSPVDPEDKVTLCGIDFVGHVTSQS